MSAQAIMILKLDKRLSYLLMFSCPFGRYRYSRLPFGAAPVGNIFQKKIHNLFTGMPNAFIIAHDILIAGFDELGKDHNVTLDKCKRIHD